MSMDRRSDAELLAACHEDAQALGAFYDRHEAAVLGFLARRVLDPEVAADLCAEVFASLLDHCRRGRRVSEPLPWLYAVARNALADYHRTGQATDRMRRRAGIGRLHYEDDELARVEALIDQLRRGEPALAELERLPPEQQHAIRAHVIEERSYAEVARMLLVPEGTVRQRVSRGVRALRTRLLEASS
jgi:RNA polymerase sigma-70 factor (ECF subfamily)